VPGPALRFLEYVFLALLYLFFLRVVRAVWVELREPRLVAIDPVVAPPVTRQAAPERKRQEPERPRPEQPEPKQRAKNARRARAAPLQLAVFGPDQSTGAVYPLGDEITIGRGPGCEVPLTSDNFVSTVHARVFRRGDEYWVEDLGSTNGTMVNGRRVARATPLQRGDRLQVGRSVLELQRR
jgi:pSer/pThr/pTyr-binding forkhead associated (FHA) protein